jgi:choline kinase
MPYKVLIPTAGTGSRLGGMTKYLNKSLITIGNKPAISRIIEMFPSDTEFVIATGYKGELVKEFFSLAYPERKIQFVDILLYEGEGSGLGLTIQECKSLLQCPFVFCSCDTLVTEQIHEPSVNWMGYDDRDKLEQYRTINISDTGKVLSINEKGMNIIPSSRPYIGLAGIHDYELFWEAMEAGKDLAVQQGESYGLKEIINSGVEAIKYTWFDTGVTIELDATKKRYSNPNAPNILEKPDETIWFLDKKVIKFSANTQFISDRVKRSSLLNGFVPSITKHTTHMYCYNYVEGDVLSKCVSHKIFEKLLDFSKTFWRRKKLSAVEMKDFSKSCIKFYKDKTYERIDMFYRNFKKDDNITLINGIAYPPLSEILEIVDWNEMTEGIPGQFHGDYHFENIIYDNEHDNFKFVDWRQDFDKFLDIGDIYYDLAKLLHGLIICHELIAKDNYEVTWVNDIIQYDFNRKQMLVECERYYYLWLNKNNYNVKKVKMLTAFIFLNIAALHHYPYALLLYALGKVMLYETIHGEWGKELC